MKKRRKKKTTIPEGVGCLLVLIVLVLFIANIELAISIIVLGLTGYIIYAVIRKIYITLDKQTERKKAEREQLRDEEDIRNLEASHNYIYVKNFITLHTTNGYIDEDIHKLHELLVLKGTNINTNVLKQCIERARQQSQYDKLEEQLLSCNSKNSEDVIRCFLDIYGENYQEHLVYLHYFLAQHYDISSQSEITNLVNDIKKRIVIEHFEKQLLSQESNAPIPKYYEINGMGGLEFEQFLGKLFSNMGYKATVTSASGDQGADLLLSKHGHKIAVQAKNYSKPVGNSAVQEVVAAINFYKVNEGMVVTNSTFTPSAIALAKANNITLIDGNELQQMIQKYL